MNIAWLTTLYSTSRCTFANVLLAVRLNGMTGFRALWRGWRRKLHIHFDHIAAAEQPHYNHIRAKLSDCRVTTIDQKRLLPNCFTQYQSMIDWDDEHFCISSQLSPLCIFAHYFRDFFAYVKKRKAKHKVRIHFAHFEYHFCFLFIRTRCGWCLCPAAIDRRPKWCVVLWQRAVENRKYYFVENQEQTKDSKKHTQHTHSTFCRLHHLTGPNTWETNVVLFTNFYFAFGKSPSPSPY